MTKRIAISNILLTCAVAIVFASQITNVVITCSTNLLNVFSKILFIIKIQSCRLNSKLSAKF